MHTDVTAPSPDTTEAVSPPASKWRCRLRWAGMAILILWLLCSSLILLVREFIIPHIGNYRTEIAAVASKALGLPVSIQTLEGAWVGRHIELQMGGVSIQDQHGKTVFMLDRINTALAWSSLLHLEPRFQRIELLEPELALRRQKDGTLLVAGISMQGNDNDNHFLDWLLNQQQILIRDAVVIWTDEMRNAPEIRLSQLQFRLDRHFSHHAFGLQARPPETLAARLDIRGELRDLVINDPSRSIGRLYIALDHADLGGWQSWVDYPFPLEGKGSFHAWFDLDGKSTSLIVADVALSDVITRLAPDLPELQLADLSGRMEATHTESGVMLATRNLTLTTHDDVTITPTDFNLTLRQDSVNAVNGGSVVTNILDLRMLSRLAAHLPLEESVRHRIAAFNPQGQIHALRLEWQGAVSAPETWSLNARFNDIGLAARDLIPGLGGLSGEIDGNNSHGRFHLAGQSMHIDLPTVFDQSRLAFASLRADGGWANNNKGLEIQLDSVTFENPDAAGSASGRYWPSGHDAGRIDLQAQLTRAEGTAVWRYLPRVVNQTTYNWVRHSIRHATVPHTELRLRGNLAEFPFIGGDGEFLVAIKVLDGLVDYASGWPAIEKLNGEVRFEGAGLRIKAEQASILGINLHNTLAYIPDLDAKNGPVMTITGQAAGATSQFLDFVSKSPVSGYINHFTDNMRAQGDSKLDLQLVIPLEKPEKTRIQGVHQFSANQLRLGEDLPALEKAHGLLRFTENDMTLTDSGARLLDAPIQIKGKSTAPGEVQFDVDGTVTIAGLRQYAPIAALAQINGQTRWNAHIGVSPQATRIQINSQLDGMSSTLPTPFAKAAAEQWPFALSITSPGAGQEAKLQGQLGEHIQFNLVHTPASGGQSDIHGGIGVFTPAPQSEHGITLAARFDTLDLDAWQNITSAPSKTPAVQDKSPLSTNALQTIDLRADTLHLLGQELNNLRLHATATPKGWQADVESDQAQGHVDWQGANDGYLIARLAHLAIQRTASPQPSDTTEKNTSPAEIRQHTLPGIDLTAEQFLLNGRDLGTLQLKAHNHNQIWSLENVSLHNPSATLEGKGTWQTGKNERSQLQLQLDTSNVGKLMTRLGYPDTVRGGQARLSGELTWHGTPTDIDYPSLSGQLTLEASKGQFNKLEPGVGRLLGVLSLQSLPRRISLDFRDVFSDGFVFDRISANIDIAHGTMKTDNLEIHGPAAQVRMHGSVDLQAETQNLAVTVQPTLSESIAIGAAAGLVNPVAGVVTYLAQKALSDPIERLFAFNYAITGSWEDPQVTKLGSNAEHLIPKVPLPLIH